jgi:hypothetical protein
VPDSADADVPLQALESVVKNGNRKRFIYISKKDILQIVSRNLSWEGR